MGVFAVIFVACGADDAPTQPETAAVDEPTPVMMPGQGATVRPARTNGDTGYFSEAIYSRALEALGYEVLDHQELENAAFYEAVAKVDVDFWANGWFPIHNTYLDLYNGEASIAGTVAAFGALQGFLVDKARAEEFNISSLADFRRDEVRLAYDADGNGKADLIGCQSDWGCAKIVGFQLDNGGLREFVDEYTGPYSEGVRNQIARFRKGGHVLFYTWTPNWTVAQLKPGGRRRFLG